MLVNTAMRIKNILNIHILLNLRPNIFNNRVAILPMI
jgi:hypothetical protein